jgi:biotin transporter BioY
MLNNLFKRLVAYAVFLILILLAIQITSALLGIPVEYVAAGVFLLLVLSGAKNALLWILAAIILLAYLLPWLGHLAGP